MTLLGSQLTIMKTGKAETEVEYALSGIHGFITITHTAPEGGDTVRGLKYVQAALKAMVEIDLADEIAARTQNLSSQYVGRSSDSFEG